MTERQGRVEQGAEDKRARDFEFAPKLRPEDGSLWDDGSLPRWVPR